MHVITDAVRQVVREELSKVPERSEYLSVREAAQIADVIPGTIRSWIEAGKLGRYQAGRHVRVKRWSSTRSSVSRARPIGKSALKSRHSPLFAGDRYVPA